MNSVRSLSMLDAIECLKAHDRRGASKILANLLMDGPEAGLSYKTHARLSQEIGEIDLSLEALRRVASTEPFQLEAYLAYIQALINHGRLAMLPTLLDSAPPSVSSDLALLNLKASWEAQNGRFEQAIKLYETILARDPNNGQAWHGLSIIKTFTKDDLSIDALQKACDQVPESMGMQKASLLYALAKALEDVYRMDEALAAYEKGAAIMLSLQGMDQDEALRQRAVFADQLISDFDRLNLAKLKPSMNRSQRPLFVTGLPRSGTTLVEQILTSHSMVKDGGELNLLRSALLPTDDFSFSGAMAYQSSRPDHQDPWGELSRDYLGMLERRYGLDGYIVDKTLNHASFMGLLLHALPDAKVVWLRRDARDCALSTYKTFFSHDTMPWSWSMKHIARYYAIEQKLYEHWVTLFPDRILTIRYENLVTYPQIWVNRICQHFGLTFEDSMLEFDKNQRVVSTSSLAQVRNPIHAGSIDKHKAYEQLFENVDL